MLKLIHSLSSSSSSSSFSLSSRAVPVFCRCLCLAGAGEERIHRRHRCRPHTITIIDGGGAHILARPRRQARIAGVDRDHSSMSQLRSVKSG
ncbi:hypothetical protein TIFTF001_024029 [Ficus carica]|uniref:Uncharacterized protein n=1 Tax=Ficus carica TaxID=3494 RepID=A0AA88AHA1_FICCA|nr:hypothetical protein TIFTF001_024029 [Ficus carica]